MKTRSSAASTRRSSTTRCSSSELELLGIVDLDVSGDNGADVVTGLDALAPDAVVYFGLGMSTRGLSVAMRGRSWPVITNSALMFGHMYPEWTADFEGWTYVDAFDEDNEVRARLHDALDIPVDQPGPMSLYDMGRLVALGLCPRAGADAPGHARRPGAREAGALRARRAGHGDGIRPLEALRARGRLPRAAAVARRQVGESHGMTGRVR